LKKSGVIEYYIKIAPLMLGLLKNRVIVMNRYPDGVYKDDLVVSEFRNSMQLGNIFIDYLQNSRTKTMISPYSLRATQQALVSTPLEWKQQKKGLRPEEFKINTVIKRKNHPCERLM
jgi:DNA primase